MSAFWKKDKDANQEDQKGSVEKKVTKEKKSKPSAKSKRAKKSDKKKGLIVPEERAELINKTLVSPMISEAVLNAQKLGKYTFVITKQSSKKDVSLAVEALYKVTVEKVNIINYKAETKFFRGKRGSRKGYKKAIVTLKKGDKIKLFS